MKRLLDALPAATVFSVFLLPIPGAEAATETVIHSFSNVLGEDGQAPHSGLLHANGVMYGTTAYGSIGTTDAGTLYSVDPKTGAETVLHSFGSAGDGIYPLAGLIDVKGTFYGTTSLGGAGACSEGCGTVFAFNPSTGAETVLHSFAGSADGEWPMDDLIYVKGKLYGTTYTGGSGGCQTHVGTGCGIVFSVDPTTGAETVLHTFQSGTSDGANPYGGLSGVSGMLYGTTSVGGSHTGSHTGCQDGCGTIFAIDRATGAETVVYSFRGGTHGANPEAGLTYVGGMFYGTTGYGGDEKDCAGYGCGTVFEFNPSTGAEKVLYSFTSSGDGNPTADLIHVKGLLYGTTSAGSSCCGSVFSLNLETRAETLLYSFKDRPDGASPAAPVVSVNGVLYGTTYLGGVDGQGAVFSIAP
jgi:uncharacterized repeat protein (TIGR03803 family)